MVRDVEEGTSARKAAARHDALPQSVRDHLVCRIAAELVPVVQKHDIEGLVMGVE